ncbi:MAG: hypothetical protein COB30_001035 [Ectothiorhodospiraceae bacterium]|nr:hypothetical protein [Ectothiorhodospiraceae bacterium]
MIKKSDNYLEKHRPTQTMIATYTQANAANKSHRFISVACRPSIAVSPQQAINKYSNNTVRL